MIAQSAAPTASDWGFNFFSLRADADHSGSVDTNDFTRMAQNFNTTGSFWSQGDANYDDTVNALDFNIVAVNFGQSNPPAPALGALVPEPAAVGTISLLAALQRRSRRRAGNPRQLTGD